MFSNKIFNKTGLVKFLTYLCLPEIHSMMMLYDLETLAGSSLVLILTVNDSKVEKMFPVFSGIDKITINGRCRQGTR